MIRQSYLQHLLLTRNLHLSISPILWPPDVNHWPIGKNPDAGQDWRQEKGMTEDEMVGRHHWLWTWIWVSSRSWWWTRRPGMLQSMGLQRIGHDWATKLNCIFIMRRNYSGFLPKARGASWDDLPFVCVPSHFSHVWLFCDPMDCDPFVTLWTLWRVAHQASSVHGISQARILECVALPSSREFFWPRDWTHVSNVSCIDRRFPYHQWHLGSLISLLWALNFSFILLTCW